MWNLDVPKTAFFYWGGKRLSFLRYMTIYSFKKLNPDWNIQFYCPIKMISKNIWKEKQFENQSVNVLNYYQYITHNLMIRPIVFDFEKLGLSNDMNEVHKSDFIRYYLINNFGGVWCDMDILFIKPMEQLLLNKNKIKSSSYYYFGKEDGEIEGHGIGFLMGTKGSKYYGDVFESAKKAYNAVDYQTIGADLLNREFNSSILNKIYQDAIPIDTEAVYAINHYNRDFLYNKCNFDMLTENAIGIHWYGGSEYVRKLTISVNHTNFKTYKNDGTLIRSLQKHFNEDF